MSEYIDRLELNDWICNDGLSNLFEEGYLSPKLIDPEDGSLHVAVIEAEKAWRLFELNARRIQDLVDDAVEEQFASEDL